MVWLLLLGSTASAAIQQITVTLTHDQAKPIAKGRLFVFTSKNNSPEPRLGPNWFSPEPFFGRDVEQFAAGQSRAIDAEADGFPGPLGKLPPGKYYVQAVLHHALDNPFPGQGVGNYYSSVAELQITAGDDPPLKLALDQRIEPTKMAETDWRREVILRSELLSNFHRQDVFHQAAVVLPANYEQQPQRRYPVLYVIPGFGGSHREAERLKEPIAAGEGETDFIRVFLSGRCLWGHHVFADSATNGPRGAALLAELIPHVDSQYRTIAATGARYVTGHSSGGWSSLWLQVNYPDAFGGVWSTAPDPVDFRDYQQVHLYAEPPQNMYRTAQGERRPIARRGTTPVIWYDDFTRMDDVLFRGGQLRSFEAVFSPLDARGEPLRMYDRRTGLVDPVVAKTWQAYDINLKLQREWPTSGPKLAGKLHVFMGTLDTFYLEGAVVQLADTLKQLGSDAHVEIVDGADHSSLMTLELRQKIRRQMSEQFKALHDF